MALSKNAKVAFIGTGIMGAPIAEHLISAGYDVTVYNRTPEKAQKLVSLGAHAAERVKDAAKDADWQQMALSALLRRVRTLLI